MAGKGRGQDGTEVVETLCSRRQPYLVKWKLNQPVMTWIFNISVVIASVEGETLVQFVRPDLSDNFIS